MKVSMCLRAVAVGAARVGEQDRARVRGDELVGLLQHLDQRLGQIGLGAEGNRPVGEEGLELGRIEAVQRRAS